MLNAKYRLDKVAQELYEGNYIQDEVGIFKEAEAFLPYIEKQARQLRDFNRVQHKQLKNNPIVDYDFVKKALHQLDGLYGYATLEKTAGMKEMAGGLFATGKKLKADVDASKKAMERAVRAVDNTHFQINKATDASAGTNRMETLHQRLEENRSALSDRFREFGTAQKELGNYQAKTQAKTSLAISAAVVPGVGLAGYAQANKEGDRR